MKNLLLLFMMACMTSLFFTSCEENLDQAVKVQPDTTKEITTRTIDDCEDCPQQHCCCVIELDGVQEAELLFCGIYTGMLGSTCGPYSPPSPCSTIPFGVSSIIELEEPTESRKYFCLANGGSFRIQNIGASTKIRFTCRPLELNPDWQEIELGPNDFLYYDSSFGCYLTECN